MTAFNGLLANIFRRYVNVLGQRRGRRLPRKLTFRLRELRRTFSKGGEHKSGTCIPRNPRCVIVNERNTWTCRSSCLLASNIRQGSARDQTRLDLCERSRECAFPEKTNFPRKFQLRARDLARLASSQRQVPA